jgi:plastocyanin
LLLLGSTSALAANYYIGIGDDCDVRGACFYPTQLMIGGGDTVRSIYAGLVDSGPHNVVADDGSFRCARGCDGEGGDGTPADYTAQWSFTRTFTTSGIVNYHDEVSHATGAITVGDVPPFAIGPEVTGAWFDPAQIGHGLFIEVLPGNRFYAAWFAFNPAGTQQAWFTGVGTYSDNTASITVVEQPSGGRWIPNFDPKAAASCRICLQQRISPFTHYFRFQQLAAMAGLLLSSKSSSKRRQTWRLGTCYEAF